MWNTREAPTNFTFLKLNYRQFALPYLVNLIVLFLFSFFYNRHGNWIAFRSTTNNSPPLSTFYERFTNFIDFLDECHRCYRPINFGHGDRYERKPDRTSRLGIYTRILRRLFPRFSRHTKGSARADNAASVLTPSRGGGRGRASWPPSRGTDFSEFPGKLLFRPSRG